MSYNGSGTFSINTAGQPVVAGTTIDATVFNNLTADLATGLSTAITKDGQTTVTANIPMSTYKITGLGAGTARTDAASLATIQDGTGVYVGTVGGTADVITLTPSPAIAAYAAGQTFRFIASGANTTNVTVNVSGVGAKAITKNGTTALAAGDISSGAMVEITYDGTRFILGAVLREFALRTGDTFSGDVTVSVSDNRTNTVDVPLTLTSQTSGSPAAGIGTGQLFQAESADEAPSDVGQTEFAFSDVSAGSEDSYFQVLLRRAGAALAAAWRWTATGTSNAIVTHANTADRTYTFPDATGNIPTVASAAEVAAMTSTATALTPNSNTIVLATQQASTSGTSIDFTGIPAGVRRITISCVGVSTSGNSNLIVQIGDSGGVETAGYSSGVSTQANAGANNLNTSSVGFLLVTSNVAADAHHFVTILTLVDAATFSWACVTGGYSTSGATTSHGGGTKSTSAVVDRIRITTLGGVDTFDAGTINIAYER